MFFNKLKTRIYSKYEQESYILQQKAYFWMLTCSFVILSQFIMSMRRFLIDHELNTGLLNLFFAVISTILTLLVWNGKYRLSVRILPFYSLLIYIAIAYSLKESFFQTGTLRVLPLILVILVVLAVFNSRGILVSSLFVFIIGFEILMFANKPMFSPDIFPFARNQLFTIYVFAILSAAFLYVNSKITDNSLELAEQELERNKELNANLEQKVKERTQRLKDIETSLKKYLPKQLVETITKGDHAAEPKTERRKLSVFFSDIKGFTDLTESMEAEDLSKLLNEYLTEMTTIANKWGGTVDKFIGDAVMIFFGAPEETPDDENAINCVKMAIEMQNRMKELQTKWFNEGIETPLEIRIGISTGTATVGNFGADDRLSYTVIGGQVNIASRLESLCEPGKILISHPTWAFVKEEIECKEREKVKVKGIQRELMVYDVVMS